MEPMIDVNVCSHRCTLSVATLLTVTLATPAWYTANALFSVAFKSAFAALPDVLVLTTLQLGLAAATATGIVMSGRLTWRLQSHVWTALLLPSGALFLVGTLATNCSSRCSSGSRSSSKRRSRSSRAPSSLYYAASGQRWASPHRSSSSSLAWS